MTEYQQRRLVNHRLTVLRHAEEVTGNVAQTCRYYGISRNTFHKWLRRYEEQGLEGLRDRSSRPHQSPNVTPAEVVGKIIDLRVWTPSRAARSEQRASTPESMPTPGAGFDAWYDFEPYASDRFLEMCRTALGSQAFNAAWDEGADMTVAELRDCMLETVPEKS